jgi:chemotaxis protein CheD
MANDARHRIDYRIAPPYKGHPMNAAHNAATHKKTTLYIGDVMVSRSPMILHTLLGSCVAVCLYDIKLCAGGMNHILLPDVHKVQASSRHGALAMEMLIDKLIQAGGAREHFIAKAFGGANVLANTGLGAVGTKNADFVREFLAAERIPLVSERLGGERAIDVHFTTDTGSATVRTIGNRRIQSVIDAEARYKNLVAEH